MKKIDDISFFRQLFLELKKNGVEECDIVELSKKLYPYFESKEYNKLFSLSSSKIQSRVVINNMLEYFTKRSKELLYSGNSRVFELNPRDNVESISRMQLDVIRSLADTLTIIKSVEDKYNVKIYNFNPALNYNLLNARGKYLNLNQRLVSDADSSKKKITMIDTLSLYECPIDDAFCSFEDGVGIDIKIPSSASYVIVHSYSRTLKGEYTDSRIYTKETAVDKLNEMALVGEDSMREFLDDLNMNDVKSAPKVLVRKLK